MTIFETGKIIKERRIMLRYSQHKLADGIMNVSNLSKLENGTQVPQKENLDLLFQRLGIDEPMLLVDALNKQEHELHISKRKLDGLLFYNKNDEALALIEELSILKEFSEHQDYKFNRQYLLRSKIAVLVNKGEYVNLRDIILEALLITVPNFREDTIAEGLFSRYEIELINQIAITYAEENNRPKSIEIMKALIGSLKKSRLEIALRTSIYPVIIYNLSKNLSLEEDYVNALTQCNEGIDLCYTYGNTSALFELYYNKACILFKTGKIKDSKYYFEHSCTLLVEMKHQDKAKSIKEHVLIKFGLKLRFRKS